VDPWFEEEEVPVIDLRWGRGRTDPRRAGAEEDRASPPDPGGISRRTPAQGGPGMRQLKRSRRPGVLRRYRYSTEAEDYLGPQFDVGGESQTSSQSKLGEESGAHPYHPGSDGQRSGYFGIRSDPRRTLREGRSGAHGHGQKENERSCHTSVAGSVQGGG